MPKKPRLPFAVQSRTEDELGALVRRIAAALAPETVPPDPGAALTATPTQARDADLARLRATEALRKVLDEHAYMLALGLAMRQDAPVTYADLGDAVGITRQAARTRWPVLPNAKPGRPKKQVQVTLSGGHPQWDGQILEYDRASVYDCDLDDVGALLMIEDGSYPDHLSMQEGVDWRAHYAPDTEDTRTTWTFQGWVPA